VAPAPYGKEQTVKPTDLSTPDHFHKVVDCQYACPAHTPVPQYIRLITEGHYAEAYMVNWQANVFPGILGRTCDRPCEPACRRQRVENEPVAICRLKRAAADNKCDISALLPKPALLRNGKRIALVGGGPASLTLARDLAPLGYRCVIIDENPKVGGMMRTRIPRFRVPEQVIDEETGYILNLGVEFRGGIRVGSLKSLLAEGWDAVFIGAGAPRGQDLALPGRHEARSNVFIGVDGWRTSGYRPNPNLITSFMPILTRPLSQRTRRTISVLSQLCAAPSVAFVQKLRTIPNDRAVFRKDERITEQGIKSQPAGFFDGGFVVGVTVTT
jgi:formate dehydrogenase beta subunit